MENVLEEISKLNIQNTYRTFKVIKNDKLVRMLVVYRIISTATGKPVFLTGCMIPSQSGRTEPLWMYKGPDKLKAAMSIVNQL